MNETTLGTGWFLIGVVSMGRYLIIILLVCFALNTMPVNAHALFKTAKVTLVVIDESGAPLEGVEVGVTFEENTSSGTIVSPKNSITDKYGKAYFSGSCNGHIAYEADQGVIIIAIMFMTLMT